MHLHTHSEACFWSNLQSPKHDPEVVAKAYEQLKGYNNVCVWGVHANTQTLAPLAKFKYDRTSGAANGQTRSRKGQFTSAMHDR